MKNEKVTLKQVKKHFKNAKEVQTTLRKDAIEIDRSKKIFETEYGFYCYSIGGTGSKEIYLKSNNQFAKIISYKDKKLKITKEQVLQLDKKEITVRELFPDLFDSKLEVGKWYKSDYPLLIFVTEVKHHTLAGYGFNANNAFKQGNFCTRAEKKNMVDYKKFNFKPATAQEIETALQNEFEKQSGVKFELYSFNTKENTLYGWNVKQDMNVIFKDGVFTKFYKKQEA